jgi:hypothetical protein
MQYASGLKVEKVGEPRSDGDTVTVTVKVTNNVMMPGPEKGTPTPKPGDPPAARVPATVLSGSIRVIFYEERDGRQEIVGGGYGNVVNLRPGESKQIEIVCTPVKNFSKSTRYEAFPDYVWTDKDPVKTTPEVTGPTPAATPYKQPPPP